MVANSGPYKTSEEVDSRLYASLHHIDGNINQVMARYQQGSTITLSEAPPTRNPSISSCLASSEQLLPFTDPEMDHDPVFFKFMNWIRVT